MKSYLSHPALRWSRRPNRRASVEVYAPMATRQPGVSGGDCGAAASI